ncbi:MAG: STAS domain-containing protein [Pseudomonadota bacterium]
MTTPEIETYALPDDPRANACGAFFDTLKSHRGKPIVIDASAVDRFDTLVAQVMVLGKRSWAADDLSFTLANPSETVTDALTRLGLADELLSERTDNDD